MRLKTHDLRTCYRDVVDHVRYHGERVVVRGEATLELLDVTLEVEDPTDCLPVGVGRRLNSRIAAVEALQLIGGVHHPELQAKAGGVFMEGVRDGGVFHGAYGTRVRAQLPVAVERLKIDPHTRQSVVVIWDPLHDLMVSDSRDYPCTVMLQFLIRDGQLQLHTTMRSNDVWLGLAYDAFQFTQLQLTVAEVLDIPAGHYFHHAVSMHLYARDLEAAAALTAGKFTFPMEGRPRGVPADTMYGAMTAARQLLAGKEPRPEAGLGWYAQALKPLWRE